MLILHRRDDPQSSSFEFPLQNGGTCAQYKADFLILDKLIFWSHILHFVARACESHFTVNQDIIFLLAIKCYVNIYHNFQYHFVAKLGLKSDPLSNSEFAFCSRLPIFDP